MVLCLSAPEGCMEADEITGYTQCWTNNRPPSRKERMTMTQVTVVAKVVANQDAVDALKAELLRLIEPTRQEEGCIEYTLHQDGSDPALFIFYETWESDAHLERHMKTDHFTRFVAAVEGLLREIVVNRLIRIA